MSRGDDGRPGEPYRRPDADPETLVVEGGRDPRVPTDEVDRDAWLAAVRPEDRDRLRAAVADDPVDVAYRLEIGGEVVWVHERGRRVDGDVVGYLFPASDRVARRRELERQRDRLDEFASVVSHDLRNPLSVALGNLDLARELDAESSAERLDRVEDALRRMDRLIGDLLRLSRQGRSVEETVDASLEAVVDRAWRTAGEASDAELVVDGDLPWIACDPDRLQRVFENLFRNAIEHGTPDEPSAPDERDASVDGDAIANGDAIADGDSSADGDPADPAVTVEVGAIEDGFYVADDGPGIDPEDRDAAFEPGHTTTSDGTGFGLAIVERIAEAHGWSVSIAEHHTGGARFEFDGVDVVEEPGDPPDRTPRSTTE